MILINYSDFSQKSEMTEYYLDLQYPKFTFIRPKHQQGVNNHHIVSRQQFLESRKRAKL